jgi:hypothetical protein
VVCQVLFSFELVAAAQPLSAHWDQLVLAAGRREAASPRTTQVNLANQAEVTRPGTFERTTRFRSGGRMNVLP